MAKPPKTWKYYLWIMCEVLREQGQSRADIKRALRELSEIY